MALPDIPPSELEAGKKQPDGTYPEGTVNDLVYKKLKKFAETVKYMRD